MPASLFLSSGDLIADRRFDFARDLRLRGDLVAAADLLAQAVELAPRFASAWFALGEVRQLLNQHAAAIAAYRNAADADPEDRHGAKLLLMRLGAAKLDAMPPAYVRTLFDQYAAKFDTALVRGLGYRGPDILLKAVLAVRHATHRPAFFKHAVDLGCGTGLAAQAFRSNVGHWTGIDLSPRMIAQARATGLYEKLEIADMIQALVTQADASADLVLAADALVYMPDLDPLFAAASRVLAVDGILAFTVETHAGEGIILGEKLRYAHSESYVRAAIAGAGLTLCDLAHVSTRNDGGVAVPGLVAVATRG